MAELASAYEKKTMSGQTWKAAEPRMPVTVNDDSSFWSITTLTYIHSVLCWCLVVFPGRLSCAGVSFGLSFGRQVAGIVDSVNHAGVGAEFFCADTNRASCMFGVARLQCL